MKATGRNDRAGRPRKQESTQPAGGSGSTFWQYLDSFCRERPALFGVLLFGLVLWTFFPAIQNDFVGYDDPAYVTDNGHVLRGITWQGFRWAFASSAASNWHPLTWLSHMLDCQLYRLGAWGHHLTNVLLHALNASLAFLVLRQMTGATWRSLIVAALFGLHPLRVESVAWVAERKDVLSTTFAMLTLCAYGRYAQKRLRAAPGDAAFDPLAGRSEAKTARLSTLDYGLALMFFALGLMCKPMLVTVPCILLLLDYWPLNRFPRQGIRSLLVEKIPFFLAAILVSVITLAVQSSTGAVMIGCPLAFRLTNAVVSYCRYLGKLFWPSNLAVFYPYPPHWPTATVLLSVLALVLVSFAALMWRRRHPYVLVGWLWFIGTLVPVIGLVQVGGQSMADRYTYVPSLGVCLLVVWGVHELTQRWRFQRVAAGVMVAVIVSYCIRLTQTQIGYWRNSESLFRHAIQVTKGNYLAHNNLGTALEKEGRFEEAIHEFQQALDDQPSYYLAQDNLGLVFDKQGRYDEAIARFEEALRDRPGYATAHKNLGIVLSKQGRVTDAILQFQEALKADPRCAEAHSAWGILLEHEGDLDQAMDHYREALRINPDFSDVRYNLGNALARTNRLDEAIAEFQKAVALKPDPDAYNNLGVALERKGLADQAIIQYPESDPIESGPRSGTFQPG